MFRASGGSNWTAGQNPDQGPAESDQSGPLSCPPSINGIPQRRQNTPSAASVSITRKIAPRASSRPPARRTEIRANHRLLRACVKVPIGPSPVAWCGWWFPAAIALLRSAPAQRFRFLEENTRELGVMVKLRKASVSACAVSPQSTTALRTSGTAQDDGCNRPVLSTRTDIRTPRSLLRSLISLIPVSPVCLTGF
jgi:hypothetical protein